MKPRILIVNPWICDFAAYDYWAKPLGLLKIAAVLKQLGMEIYFIDCLSRIQSDKNKESQKYGTGHYKKQKIETPTPLKKFERFFYRYGVPKNEVIRCLKNIKTPDLILITSIMTYWYIGVNDTINEIRKIFPKTKIILGGIYATLCLEHAKNSSGADIVYKGNDINEIINIVFKALKLTLPTKTFGIIDCPLPAYELLNSHFSLPIQTSFGCVFNCTYCASKLLNTNFLQRKPEDVVNEIAFYQEKFGTENFAFYDDALLVNADNHIKIILDNIIKKGIKANFHAPNGLHARFIDSELAGLFKKANFKTLKLSFESQDPVFQQKTGAKVTNADLIRAVGFLKKAKLTKKEIAVYTLIGYPKQTQKEVMADIEFIKNLNVQINLANYALIPGTFDYQELQKQGCIAQDLDPLFHSHSIAPLLWGNFTTRGIRKIRNKISVYNNQG